MRFEIAHQNSRRGSWYLLPKKPLGASLTPGLVHTEGHIFRALLPSKQLDISFTLVNASTIEMLFNGYFVAINCC